MRSYIKPAVIALFVFASFYAIARLGTPQQTKKQDPVPDKTPPLSTTSKIQVAVLLDVSNSMDGLIEQAKAQLWNMVSVMGKATCDGVSPSIQIALYEYGRSSNDVKDGYVKQITGFTSDLDFISQKLFALNTNGGDEYCGQVMYKSLTEMNWDTVANSYKVIFIAGNEDFLQGQLSFTKACTEARKKNVIVNTIYCGDKMQGVREHWNLGSECGSGSFTNINQDAVIDDIPTPYDSTIFVLNDQLNKTYLSYGANGIVAYEQQAAVDDANMKMNKSVMAKRASVKAKKSLYDNKSWDAVDAISSDSLFYRKVDMATLPDSLKGKTRAELKLVIEKKSTERKAIQQAIEDNNVKRETYIAKEKAKKADGKNEQTLESEIERIVREQAKRFNMVIQ